jgi:catechol 2,3-dioxygenase-like lactoylglutathione lyase family enzyme
MLDHVSIGVSDLERSRAFYEAAFAPLGVSALLTFPGSVGFGRERQPQFFIRSDRPVNPVHLAFAAPDRATVDAFHVAALAAGGTDNGPPGVREVYHPTYYGAFVLDPDGYNVEAVCHRRPG